MRRIAIAGIAVEVLAQSGVLTQLSDFRQFSGATMSEIPFGTVPGMIERLRAEPDVEIVPLMWAYALPGGRVRAQDYRLLKHSILSALRQSAPLDGVCIANHGAMEVEGLDAHGDTDFLEGVRQTVGPDVPIAVALDHHGNLTDRFIRAGTVFTALRTAPHRDYRETGLRAADHLLRVIRDRLQPHTAFIKLPLLIPGECATTHTQPAQSLFASLPAIDAQDGVIEAVIMIGFAWNDLPWSGSSVLVTTERDPSLARTLAARLAAEMWSRRHEFVLRMETAGVLDGLRLAYTSSVTPVFLSDSGDNVTAGAPGDQTVVLRHVLDMGGSAAGARAAVVGLYAPPLVAACRDLGAGTPVIVDLDALTASRSPDARGAAGTIEGIDENGQWVAVRFGAVLASFHAVRTAFTTWADFARIGVDPGAYRLIVVKLGYLFPELEPLARRHVLLLSPGLTALDLSLMDWSQVPRPIFPIDRGAEWNIPS